MRPRLPLLVLLLAALGGCRWGAPAAPRSHLILWAWERPEDLRFVGDRAEVAVRTAFIEISTGALKVRGRRFPLKVARPPTVSLVHVEIAPGRPLAWTPELRSLVSAAVLHYGRVAGTPRVQVDFEVRESERAILLDVLSDVRRGLPKGISLSMTALASWCDTENWLDSAPVDEIVPMLFRLQPGGERLRNRLAKGGDFRNPRCRTALGIATDSPVLNAPAGRRVYVFDPKSWTEADFRRAQRDVEAWR